MSNEGGIMLISQNSPSRTTDQVASVTICSRTFVLHEIEK